MGLDYIPFLSPIKVGNILIGDKSIKVGDALIGENKGTLISESAIQITDDKYNVDDIEAKMSDTKIFSNKIQAQDFITIYPDPYAVDRALFVDQDYLWIKQLDIPYPYTNDSNKLYDWMLGDIARSTVVVVTKDDVPITDFSMKIEALRGTILYGYPTLDIKLSNIRINGEQPSTSGYRVTLYIQRSNEENMILINKLLTYLNIPEEAL